MQRYNGAPETLSHARRHMTECMRGTGRLPMSARAEQGFPTPA